jgi:hypothetical protein
VRVHQAQRADQLEGVFIDRLGLRRPDHRRGLASGTITLTAIDGEGISQTVSFTLGLFARFQSLFFALSSALVVYLFLIVVTKLIKTKTMLMVFLYILVVALLGLIVYSIIVEWDQYYLLFTTGDIDYYSPTISLFSNTNVFGYYLSLGIFALGILDSLKHRFWHYGLMWSSPFRSC